MVARQAPLSVRFSRQEHWSGLPFPSPGVFPDPGIKPRCPVLQADSLLTEPPGKPWWYADMAKIGKVMCMDWSLHNCPGLNGAPCGEYSVSRRISFFLSISSRVFSPSDELFSLTWVLFLMVLRVTLSWLHRGKYCELVHGVVLRFPRILLPKISKHFLNLFHFCTFLSLEVAFTLALGNF